MGEVAFSTPTAGGLMLQASSLLRLFLRPTPISFARQQQQQGGRAPGGGEQQHSWDEESADDGGWGGDGYDDDGADDMGAEGYNAGAASAATEHTLLTTNRQRHAVVQKHSSSQKQPQRDKLRFCSLYLCTMATPHDLYAPAATSCMFALRPAFICRL